jgi:uncharacterized Zn-finger protein
MARNAALPILTAEPSLTHYLEEIRRFPMLERQEQYMLAKRWREHGDRDAAHKLVTSHLRLVTKIARDYFASSIGCLSRALQMESYPKFHNEVGVPIVRLGCREFKCIGDKPPQDHPHIYLKIGDASEIVCPYCSTLFRFDPNLGANEADPADCAYGDRD